MQMAQSLEQELKAYGKALPELIADSGKYVVVKGDNIVGTFDTYADAVKFGISKFGLDLFMVKQIALNEQVHHFSRDHDFKYA